MRAALLAELNGGKDAALVVQMVEQDVTPEAQVRPVDPHTQAEAPPQVQEAPSDGHTAATAVEISDSDDELLMTFVRRSSSSD